MTFEAKVIKNSISLHDKQLISLQLRYPRFIHAELMTHRAFSRNASSSRAVPVKKLIQDVIDDPVYPSYWGKNQPGMQAKEECNEPVNDPFPPLYIAGKRSREMAWENARDNAIKSALAFEEAGYHKQIVNRLLEPFSHINVIVTATEWKNFFALRRHPDAQPEIRELADTMYEAITNSEPTVLHEEEWHLPYITDEDKKYADSKSPQFYNVYNILISCSVARCARVSYVTHEFKAPSIEEDIKLYKRLIDASPPHMSPAEHQATPDTLINHKWTEGKLHGNFCGWVQYRKCLGA